MTNFASPKKQATDYVGRFAPSPSGPLHFGSLVAALASYLDAKHHSGLWLVRMEDLDPPREVPKAADTILKQLEQHGLHWDQSVLYQNQRHKAYQEVLEQLHCQQLCFPCDCSRQRLVSLNGNYDGHCLISPPEKRSLVAYRIRTTLEPYYGMVKINDLFQGKQHWNLPNSGGDFIIKRKDQLFAYQLACAVDDIHQQISHVIRGSDLLDSTPRQIHIMRNLGHSQPNYGHIPVAINSDGKKLSKQNLAQTIDDTIAVNNLQQALAWLNHFPPTDLLNASVTELLNWAIENWRRDNIQPILSILAPQNHQQT